MLSPRHQTPPTIGKRLYLLRNSSFGSSWAGHGKCPIGLRRRELADRAEQGEGDGGIGITNSAHKPVAVTTPSTRVHFWFFFVFFSFYAPPNSFPNSSLHSAETRLILLPHNNGSQSTDIKPTLYDVLLSGRDCAAARRDYHYLSLLQKGGSFSCSACDRVTFPAATSAAAVEPGATSAHSGCVTGGLAPKSSHSSSSSSPSSV